MKKIIALSAIILTFAGCKKESDAGDKPKLTFISVSTTDVPADLNLVTFNIRLQDGDGDVRFIYINDNRIVGDTITFDERDIPDLQTHSGINLDAELELAASDFGDDVFVRLRGGDLATRPNPDTMQLRIYVVDMKNNVSDTLVLPKVAVHR